LAAAADDVVADVPLLMLPEAPLPVVLPLALEPTLGLALPVDDPLPVDPDIALLSLA
jgi:hypothetical protein